MTTGQVPMVPPVPVELTRELVEELRSKRADGDQPVAYVLRYGAPVWVTVSVEDVIANIPDSMVEHDPDGGWRLAQVQ